MKIEKLFASELAHANCMRPARKLGIVTDKAIMCRLRMTS